MKLTVSEMMALKRAKQYMVNGERSHIPELGNTGWANAIGHITEAGQQMLNLIEAKEFHIMAGIAEGFEHYTGKCIERHFPYDRLPQVEHVEKRIMELLIVQRHIEFTGWDFDDQHIVFTPRGAEWFNARAAILNQPPANELSKRYQQMLNNLERLEAQQEVTLEWLDSDCAQILFGARIIGTLLADHKTIRFDKVLTAVMWQKLIANPAINSLLNSKGQS